jgi:hypothetical protein
VPVAAAQNKDKDCAFRASASANLVFTAEVRSQFSSVTAWGREYAVAVMKSCRSRPFKQPASGLSRIAVIHNPPISVAFGRSAGIGDLRVNGSLTSESGKGRHPLRISETLRRCSASSRWCASRSEKMTPGRHWSSLPQRNCRQAISKTPSLRRYRIRTRSLARRIRERTVLMLTN